MGNVMNLKSGCLAPSEMNLCLPFGRSSKDLSVEELETLSAGTNPRTSHHLSPGIGEGSTQWPSLKRQDRAIVSLTNIGTILEATLELFQRPHWNCFRGSSGTVSGARLKLFQRQHWNSFKDNIWETSLMHCGAHACRLDLSCVFHCSEGQHSVPRGAAGAALRPSLADLHRGFREGPGRTAGEEQEGRSFQRDAAGAQDSGPVRCRHRNGCNKHTCFYSRCVVLYFLY